MKIAVWHNLPSGGGARALETHIRGLVERGHEITVWSNDPTANGFIKFPVNVTLNTVPLLRSESLPTLSENISSFFFKKDKFTKAMEIHCQQCAKEINKGGFDVLFANSCRDFAAPFITRYVNIPTTLYLQEPLRYFYEAQPYTPWHPVIEGEVKWFRRSYWKLFFEDLWKTRKARTQVREERLNVEAADKLLVNSIFSSESCARAYNRTGEVCYLSIDSELFKPINKKVDQPYIIGVGNLFFNKNPELAISAVALLPSAQRPKLIWVANMRDETYHSNLQKLADEKGVVFEVKEMVTDEELISLLSNALCMVYTSRLEPFGYAPLEANACGTIAVGVTQGGVKETIVEGQNGFLSFPDAESIAKKLFFVVQNPDKVEAMKTFCRENVVKNWSFEAAIDRIERALTKCVEEEKLEL